MNQSLSAQRLETWAALLIALAGVIHLVIVPQHWAHAPAHGSFFTLVGIAEIAWGTTVWRRPSATLYHIGGVGVGGLVVLWGITRLLPAPYGHGPEPVETFGIVCKVSEGLGMAVLAILVFQATASRTGRFAAWRAVSLLVIAALVAGFLTYGVARAAEPMLPWLGAPAEQHHEHESPPEPEHMHDSAIPGTSYGFPLDSPVDSLLPFASGEEVPLSR